MVKYIKLLLDYISYFLAKINSYLKRLIEIQTFSYFTKVVMVFYVR